MIASFSVSAQKAPYQEYDKRVKSSEMVSALSSDLFGDNVSLYNGSTQFTVFDIDLPGNNALPVKLGRTFRLQINNDTEGFSGFGIWDLEVPQIYATFGPGGWSVSGNGVSNRCSQYFYPYETTPFSMHDIWSGTKLNIPGRGEQTVLWIGGSGNQVPTDGAGYYWTTRDNVRLKCTSMLNYPGQGFIAVDSEGTQYFLNYAIERNGGILTKASSLHGDASLGRVKVHIVATRVQDRHGNYVNYEYVGDQLRRIVSSDGREITLIYTNGVVTQASAHGRHWNYAYAGGTQIGRFWRPLTTVTQPDTTSWSYNGFGPISMFPSIQDGSNGDARCLEPLPDDASATLVATHPSGAVGTFNFGYMRHGISGTHVNACVFDGQLPGGPERWSLAIPHYFFVMSLGGKQISGPGLQTMSWTYAYGQPLTEQASYGGAYCDTCDKEKSVWVTNPDGTIDEHVFGVLFNYNDGRLLAKYKRDANQVVRRAEINEYVSESEINSMPFPKEIGYMSGSNDLSTIYNRPVKRVTILQDGDIAGPVEYVPPPPPTTDPPLPPGPGDPGPPVCEPQPPTYLCEQPTALPGGPVMMASAASPAASMSTTSSGTPPSAFIRQVNTFDALARPVDETRQGPLHSRRTVTAYHDNTSKWVLGQVASVTCVASVPASGVCDGNDVMSATAFDPPTALPVAHYSFGKLNQTLSYHADGTVAVFRDGNNNATTLTHWMRGIPQTIKHPPTSEAPAGAVESAVVNDHGWITSATDENGYTTGYGYDAMGRLASIVYPSDDSTGWNTTALTFAPSPTPVYGLPAGHWRQVVQTGNRRAVTMFDALWRPVVQENYDAADISGTISQVATRYEPDGRPSFVSYPQRNLDPAVYNTWANPSVAPNALGTHTFRDALGRTTSVSQDSEHGLLTTLTQYLPGFQTQVTNPRNFSTLMEYQAFDQPTYDAITGITQFAGADTSATEIHRDIFGKPYRIRKRNANGSLFVDRHYVYDSAQQLCKVVEPETGATIMDYDGAGNLQWSASGLYGLMGTSSCDTIAGRDSGRKVTRYYDARSRLSSLLFPDGLGNQAWTYTPDGLPATITTHNSLPSVQDGQQVINAYAYNRRRLMVGESVTQKDWYAWGVGYGYDANASLATQSYYDGSTLSYQPNALGQPTRVQDHSGFVFASGAQYYPNGAIKQFTYGNGIAHAMIQNARQLPVSVVDAGVSDLYSYFDANGNVTDIYDVARGAFYNRHMQYDGLDRLTAAGSWVFGGDAWHRFTYDALDNMKSWKLPGVKDYAEYVYNPKNQLTNIKNTSGATVVSLEYDLQGNLDNKSAQNYDFDIGNRLREVSGKEYYRYDGHGRRVMAWRPGVGSVFSQYTSDGKVFFQWDEGQNKRLYNIYLGNSVVAIREVSVDGSAYATKYQHTDALGSPVAVTDVSGAVIERNDYEPYGAVIGKPNYQGIGYTGHVQDAATGLTYMQQRYYDPQVGLFLSVDPATAYSDPVGMFNRYRYANNNPYRFTDPDGRFSCDGISTCRVAAQERMVASGQMTQQQKQDNDQARGVGAIVGTAIVAAVASPNVRNGLVTAGLEASTQAGKQMTVDGKSMNEVTIDKSDVAVAGVIGAFSPTTIATGKQALINVGAIRALRTQARNTAARAEKVAGRIQAHASSLRTAVGAWVASKFATATTQNAVNTVEEVEGQR